ncbi:uncharacterized protein LOC111710958 [Eurytemora carolleeae]|uniref:uncharacterized protein LOC111710958 n=1 Tax=Eurytemora carolleeae TaxID=1294199 RepID=UPI000C75DAF0|nr:uncharacterized protein LOC111710958 [Eurytemora carolleeae]|eukprot:XP_023340934.1 uncharacterized protein LOC111710958 [Eurytemora affinis]
MLQGQTRVIGGIKVTFRIRHSNGNLLPDLQTRDDESSTIILAFIVFGTLSSLLLILVCSYFIAWYIASTTQAFEYDRVLEDFESEESADMKEEGSERKLELYCIQLDDVNTPLIKGIHGDSYTLP